MEQDQSQGRDGTQEALEDRLTAVGLTSLRRTSEAMTAGEELARFREAVFGYYRRHRRRFPWRETGDAYAILVSELMLQQTQTERVRQKYQAFLERFPDFGSLAAAPMRDVLLLWQGLGYNRRARFLKQSAEMVLSEYGGSLPEEPDELRRLPGVGSATAGALAAFVHNRPVVFIETNIRRAVLHWFFGDRNGVPDKEIRPVLEAVLDRSNPREWYYALMDYGAALGRGAAENPNRRSRHYTRQSRFEGSRRQRRGQILRLLTAGEAMALAELDRRLSEPAELTRQALAGLESEGFIVCDPDGKYRLK